MCTRLPIPRVCSTFLGLAIAWLASLPLAAVPAHADMLEVPSVYPTIAAALAVAMSDDVVRIACGTYNEFNLTVPDGVTVTSVTGDIGCVTIDPGTPGERVFLVDGGPETVLNGLTIANATGFVGVALHGAGSPTVTNCSFIGNSSQGFVSGGAVELAAPHFEDCFFLNNFSSNGGAVHCTSGGVFIDCVFQGNTGAQIAGGAIVGTVDLIEDCVFIGNTAFFQGGAIDGCVQTIRGSVFVNNSVASSFGRGGALSLSCDVLVENCTFYGNRIQNPAPSSDGGVVIAASGSELHLENSILAFNVSSPELTDGGVIACIGGSSVDVSCTNVYGTAGAEDWTGCLLGLEGIDGNISEDPLFCDAVNHDFSLSSASPSYNTMCGIQGAFGLGCPTTDVPATGNPARLGLRQNVPNPFNPSTRIDFDVPAGGADVRIAVYDVRGRLVRTLVRGRVGAGTHEARWDGTDEAGLRAGSGVYFCRMNANGVTSSRKMVLLK